MTRTRNMADLLDSSGDIKSSALDNVPPSNDASALTTGTLPAARLPATIDGRDVSADGAKLDGIEASATADQTDAEIKTAYENNSDTNAFTDALQTKLSGIEASADVTDTANVTSAGALMTTGGTMSGNLNHGDSVKAQFGAGNDLQIYHDGNNSYVEDAGSGYLVLKGSDPGIALQNSSAANLLLTGTNDVSLLFSGNAKLATTNTGIDVTGNAVFDDNGKAIFGAGNDLQLYHDGSNSVILDNGTGGLRLQTNSLRVLKADASENIIQGTADGSVILYHNNIAKLTTATTGVSVTGTVAATAFTGDGSALTGITDTNTTYSAGNGLTLSGTQFRLGGNSIKQLIVNSPNTGVASKSGGWTEVHSSLRTSITCTSASSKLIISFTFVYGGNNNSQIGAFKIRDVTGNFDVNMASFQSRAASHGTTRHRDHDVNDVEMITVTALVEASQTSTSSRTYSLYHKNEGNGGVTKYFFGWAQNLSQGFYAKPVCTIMEV